MKSKKESDKDYSQSDKGKARTKRYNKSPKRKECEARFLEKIMGDVSLRAKRGERAKKWRENNPSTSQRRRQKILLLLGSKCSNCGIEDYRVLQIDHINGGGYRERKQFGTGGNATARYYAHILEVGGKGYQLLCANCNWIKRYEQKEFNQGAVE